MGTISGGTFKIHSSKSFAVRVDYGDAAYKLDGNNGYTYVKDNKTYWIDKNSGSNFNYAGSVKPLPITSINASIAEGDLTYGYSGDNTPLMTVSATPLNADSTITYSWYRAYGASSTTPDGAAFATVANCSIPAFTPALDVGTVYFMAGATCDGYTRYSAPIAVTVVPRTLTGDMFAVADTPPVIFKPKADGTGEGVEQYPVLTTNLTEGTDYRFASGGTDVGRNTAVIEGMGNYTGSVNKTWYMDPAVITSVDVAVADKSYDGNTSASVSAVSVTANGTTITLDPQYYQISAQFDSADVGSRRVDYSLKILSNNYTFANGSRTTAGNSAGTITKDTGVPKNTVLYVKNGVANSYSFDLSQLLSTLNTGCSYGDASYSIDTLHGGISSNYLTDGDASIDNVNKVLTLPIKAYAADTEGEIGTLYIDITTDNYNIAPSAKLTIIASNKTPLAGTPVLSTSTITYGQKLDTIVLSGSMTSAVDSTETVSGTFRWSDPNMLYSAGNYDAAWLFTPDDTDSYLPAGGEIAITVNKVIPVGTPSYTAVSKAGKKLSDADLGIGSINVRGSIRWNDDMDTEVARGTSYGWTFTPDDENNYETLTGSIVLWRGGSGHKHNSSSSQTAAPSEEHAQNTASGALTADQSTVQKGQSAASNTAQKGQTAAADTIQEEQNSVSGTVPTPETESQLSAEEEMTDQETGAVPADSQDAEEPQNSEPMRILLLLMAVFIVGIALFVIWIKKKEKEEEE